MAQRAGRLDIECLGPGAPLKVLMYIAPQRDSVILFGQDTRSETSFLIVQRFHHITVDSLDYDIEATVVKTKVVLSALQQPSALTSHVQIRI
jgi:hypothetical protein